MSAPDQGEDCQLQMLQQDLIEHVLSLAQDSGTILSALSASKVLREAAAQLVECIIAKELPPAYIWKRFPRATRVSTKIDLYSSMQLEEYERLFGSLPDRVSSIDDRGASAGRHIAEQPSSARSLSFARALLASACASSLLSVQISSVSFTPAAADLMLQGLPQLQEARLVVHQEAASQPGAQQQHVWRPQVGGCPELLTLEVPSPYNASSQVTVDLAALTAGTKLQRILAEVVTNIPALAALTNLQSLDLRTAECSAATWDLLAKLPKLGTLSVRTLEISADAAVAAALTRVHAHRALQLLHNQEQLPGCLARQLPQLQHAQLGLETLQVPVALGVQGHQQLRELAMPGAAYNTQAWAVLAALPSLETLKAYAVAVDAAAPVAAALRVLRLRAKLILEHAVQQLPQLQQLTARADLRALSAALQGHQQLQQLIAYHDTDLLSAAADLHNDVLADLASCSKLAVVQLPEEPGPITAAGCAALAAGACRESLRMVELSPADFELASVGPLLHMPALEFVTLQQPTDGQQDAQQEVAGVRQQAEQVLSAAGLPGWRLLPVYCSIHGGCMCMFTREVEGNG